MILGTPPLDVFLSTWRFAPVSVVALIAAGTLYAIGIVRLRNRGEHWPLRYTLGFYLLGLGSYAVIELGFLGTMSTQLRWAFAVRLALLIFVVPLGLITGRPLELLNRASGATSRARMQRISQSRPVRLFGNAMFATIFVAAVLCVFLTPFSGTLRNSLLGEDAVSLLVPIIGMVLVLPIASAVVVHTTVFLAIEFLLTFAELLIDAIPGLTLRLNDHVLDGLASIQSNLGWWPNALRDQQLAGDGLWFIAEFADLPILVLLLVRWVRSDRRDSNSVDELSDEEYDKLTQAYLRGELNTSMVRERSTLADGSPTAPG